MCEKRTIWESFFILVSISVGGNIWCDVDCVRYEIWSFMNGLVERMVICEKEYRLVGGL